MKNKLAFLTIFLGSFLIFGIQPMVGRTLLPVFGGTAAVWVVCLCAFQVFLLGGYWYADWLARNNGKTAKIKWHLALLSISAIWTVIIALNRSSFLNALGSTAASGNPAFEVLLCVLWLVGIPYMLLGSNSSLVQVFAGGNYKLYSISNAGSLLGLLAYPFVFEPYVALTTQWIGFAVGIAVYAALLFALSCKTIRTATVKNEKANEAIANPSASGAAFLWFLLPASSCFLLDALTTHVTLDVMPMPLIWTGSLGLFLLSYIIGFSGKAEKIVKPSAFLTLGLIIVLCWTKEQAQGKMGLQTSLCLYGLFLLTACTFLHSWLYTVRPAGDKLTKYYLWQSIGGAVGGVIASIAFPLLTKTIVEYPIALFGIGALVSLGLLLIGGKMHRTFAFAAIVLTVVGGWGYANRAGKETRPVVYRGRGFFGTIEVLESEAKTQNATGRIHEFVHGTTVHGIQALLPGKEKMPTVYYTPNACGYGITAHPKYRAGKPMRVNLIGLGVGVMMSYARPGDYYHAYEISADALNVATDTNLFTFVSGCPAQKDIVLGDARTGLEAELAAGVEPYDVIVVDAFTGDNIPYHLSTVEAFDLYFKLLKPDGVICVNISNWHLNLLPFIRALGDHYNCPVLGLSTQNDYARLQFATIAAILCRDPSGFAPPPFGDSTSQALPIDFSTIKPMSILPTDEKGSFVSLIRR